MFDFLKAPLRRNDLPTFKLRLIDIYGCEATGSFSDLALLLNDDYFKVRRHWEDVFAPENPPWTERITIVAPDYRQKVIYSRPFFRPRPGTCFVIFFDDGRIDRLEIAADKKLLSYDFRKEDPNEADFYRSDFRVDDLLIFSRQYSCTVSMSRIVKIIMLKPIELALIKRPLASLFYLFLTLRRGG